MTAVETIVWAALALLFWTKGFHRRFPAMGYYLGLHAFFAPIFLMILHEVARPWGQAHHAHQIYFLTFFVVYSATAVLLFFICIEVFRAAMEPFPGIARLAIVIFRWVAVVAVIVGVSSVSYAHKGLYIFGEASYSLMRSVSVLELCVLAFLCLSMNALRLTVRDLSFGIALGFGMFCANDFIDSLLVYRHITYNDPLQFVYEALILAAQAIWLTYCLLPEPARRPILVPVNSTIYRWNEIASALGHGTRVAVQQSANPSLFSDVEHAMERVLARNLKDNESET